MNGCSYYVEVNEKSFVIAIGIDKGKNELLSVSFLFTSPDAGSGEEGGGEKEKEKDIVTVEAPTVYSAMRLLNTFRSKQIDIAHTELIVFSQELAEKGIKDYVTDFVNTRSFRPSIYLCVSQNGAEKFLKSIEPKQDIFIEKYIERLFSKVTNNDINEAYLYNNYFTYRTGSYGTVLPLVGVAGKDEIKEAEEDFKAVIPDDFSANYTAEDVPIDKKDAAVLCGYAVFNDEKMVGTLGITESDLVKMVSKNLPYGEFSVYFPEKKKYVTVNLRQTAYPKIKVQTGDVAEIDIEVDLWGEFTGVDGALKTKEDCERFSAYLNESLTKKLGELFLRTQSEFGADIMNLGDYAKKNFLTNSQWSDYDWKEKYKTAVIRPVINVEINDYGELRYSPGVQRKEDL